MPVPTSKDELLQQSHDNFIKLKSLLESQDEFVLSRTFSTEFLNRNVRDVLAHLHHWHVLFLEWYHNGMLGIQVPMPAAGYSWKDTPQLNQWIQKKYLSCKLHEVMKLWIKSHHQVHDIIKIHSEEELFTKRKYFWTGSSSLAVYLRAATCSHYDWAYKLLVKNRIVARKSE